MSATLTVSWWQHTRRIYLLSVIWSDLKHLPVKSGWRKCDLGFWFKLASTCALNLSFLLLLQVQSHPSPWLPHDELLQIHFSHHHIHLTLLSILPCYLLPPYYAGKIPGGCFVEDVTGMELKMMMREMVQFSISIYPQMYSVSRDDPFCSLRSVIKSPDASTGILFSCYDAPFSFLGYLGNHWTNDDHYNDIYK